MKRITRILIICLTLSLSFLSNPQSINANNVDIELVQTGVIRQGHYEAKKSKGETISTGGPCNFLSIVVNGDLAFCIEPEVAIGSGGGYTTSSFTHANR